MSQYYQDLDAPVFDYDLQVVGGISDRRLRGPAVDLSRPFIACLGAAQTFGRFCHRPFPMLLAARLGRQVLNVGLGGAGPRLFSRPEYLQLANRAELVILQVLSGRSEANSLFDNSERGTLRGIRVADGKSMRFEDFLEELIGTASPALVRRVIEETQENYVKHTIDLLRQITRPTILFWFADRSPDDADSLTIRKRFPQLVTRSMVERMRTHGDAYVECTSREGLPQLLWRSNRAVDGTMLEKGFLVNRYYPSPEMHAAAAGKLEPVCRDLLQTSAAQDSAFDFAIASHEKPTLFVIIGAERTGTNLFVGLLDAYPDCLVGGELFNMAFLKSDRIPGRLGEIVTDQQLVALRKDDPVRFLSELFDAAGKTSSRAIGFKFLYGHGDNFPGVRDHLSSRPDIRVIHIKRRNLLRRLLSERRAAATGIWSVPKHAAPPVLPSVHLDAMEFIRNVAHIEAKQAEYDELFSRHEVLEVFYEDFVSDPLSIARKAAKLLRLKPRDAVNLRPQKTGTDPLSNAISNYRELKGRVLRWAAFFDE